MEARPVVDGLEAVDADLAGLADRELADQVEVFAAIHRRLTTALAVTGGPGDPPADQPRRS